MNADGLTEELAKLILLQRKERNEKDRNEKINKLLLLLGTGAVLATLITVPGSGKALKYFLPKKSDWDEWKEFNEGYLKRTIKRLEKSKNVKISNEGGFGIVELTESGRKKVLRLGLDTLTI